MNKQFKESEVSAMYHKQSKLGCGGREGRRKLEDVKVFCHRNSVLHKMEHIFKII